MLNHIGVATIERAPRIRRALTRRARPSVVATLMAAALVAVGLSAVASAPAQAAVGNTSAVSDNGSRIVSETAVTRQIIDIRIQSTALGRVERVRLLLPRDWYSQPTASWPSLWLLHGANPGIDGSIAWVEATDVEQFMADKNVLTVMPNGGPSDFYSKPWNFGAGGDDWPTFHTKELPQLLQRAYRANGSNAIAGISMGGYGAMKYAWENPGMFKAAASYSGMLDTQDAGNTVIVGIVRQRENQQLSSLWGVPFVMNDMWAANNPTQQVARLRGVSLYVFAGDGIGDPAITPGASDNIEPWARRGADNFLAAAQRAGVPVTANLSHGIHNWPQWGPELKRSYPQLAQAMGSPTYPAGAAAPAAQPAAAQPNPLCRVVRSSIVRTLLGC